MATTTTVNCLRGSSQMLTRTWILTPSQLHHRAGRCFRRMKPLAYRFFIALPKQSIKHNSSPYIFAYQGPRMPTPIRRSFHSSKQFAASSSTAIPHISLHIAAASSAKGSKYEPEKTTVDFPPGPQSTIGMQSEGNLYQKRRSRPASGEDAYFVASVGGDQHTIAMGVCDGVGGWQEHGINPSDFSHGLTYYMAQNAMRWESNSTPGDNLHPKKLMNEGYNATLRDPQIRAGGSTACIAVTDPNGRMRTANLGDSGFVQVRLGTVCQHSPPQTHSFNTPYQMSKIPPEIMTQAAIFGGLPIHDTPDRAEVADSQLQHGDIVVFATDGVWDNLSSQDILTIVSRLMRERGAWERTEDKGFVVSNKVATLIPPQHNEQNPRPSLASVIASHIAGEAKIASMDRKRDGPFAKAVQREYPMDRWHGGKVDDITVLVMIAVEKQSASEEAPLKAKL